MKGKPEKMSDADVNAVTALTAQESDSASTERWRRWANRLLAHIAALTAERDAHENESRSRQAGWDECSREVDALRERVQALKMWGLHVCSALGLRWEPPDAALAERLDEMKAAERSLAAIRQRAEESRTNLIGVVQKVHGGACGPEALTVSAKVARYVVGEDATGVGPNVCEHGEHPAPPGQRFCAMACQRCESTDTDQDGCAGVCGRSEEPSTVEAQDKAVRDDGAAALSALSLLERRTGAMEKAMRTFCETAERWHPPKAFGLTEDEARALIPPMRLALTDAPPVFTLEEVEAAMVRWKVDADTRDAVLAALREGSR